MGYIQDEEVLLYEFEAELRHETNDSDLIYDGGKAVWLPKSKTERDGNTFIVPEWLVIHKEIV